MTTPKSYPKCYIASPCGFSESTKLWYDTNLLPLLEMYVDVLDPWSVSVDHILKAPAGEKPGLWTDLGEHHFDTIEDANFLVAILDQEPPDNGTVCEVVWAAAHNIPVIGYRNDSRTCGEDGMLFNLMISAAIRRSGGKIVTSLRQLEIALGHPHIDALLR